MEHASLAAQVATVAIAVLAMSLTHYGLTRGALAQLSEATRQLRCDHDSLETRFDLHMQAPQHGVEQLVSRDMCNQIHTSQAALWAERFDKLDTSIRQTNERLLNIERLMRSGPTMGAAS